MKKGYKIGLFFVCVMIVALVAVLLWRRYTMNGFLNENAQNNDGAGRAELGAECQHGDDL